MGDGQFQKIPTQQKRLKKIIVQGEPWEKNRASVFYYPFPIFDVEKILAQAIAIG